MCYLVSGEISKRASIKMSCFDRLATLYTRIEDGRKLGKRFGTVDLEIMPVRTAPSSFLSPKFLETRRLGKWCLIKKTIISCIRYRRGLKIGKRWKILGSS